MKGFKKFWLVLYLLITGLFFLAVVIFGAAQIMEIIQIPLVKPLDYYFTLPSLYVAGAILLVFSIYGLSLIGTLRRRRGIPVVRKITAEGDINITVDAIKNIAETVVREFPSFSLDSTGVMVKDNNVDIAIRVFVNDINHMTDAAINMQTRAKEVIESHTGILVNSVRVLINDVKGTKPIASSSAIVPKEPAMPAEPPKNEETNIELEN
jgi:uncharacterized alkaline shock family protein YloU